MQDTTMEDSRFDILFGGEILAGFAPATVAENLGRLFKASPETVAKLMGGGTHALKRGADRDTALKYQAAMQKAGARAILREVGGEPVSAPVAPAAAPSGPAAAPPAAQPVPAAAETVLTLAPQQGEILADHEKPVVAAVSVDTSHIKLVSTFMAPPEPERAPPPPPPQTAHLTMAAVGEDLLPERPDTSAPPPPDTSAISLAEPGSRLTEEPLPMAVELPDLSALSLAPPGSPLDEIRPERTPLNPDTSALSLAPQDP